MGSHTHHHCITHVPHACCLKHGANEHGARSAKAFRKPGCIHIRRVDTSAMSSAVNYPQSVALAGDQQAILEDGRVVAVICTVECWTQLCAAFGQALCEALPNMPGQRYWCYADIAEDCRKPFEDITLMGFEEELTYLIEILFAHCFREVLLQLCCLLLRRLQHVHSLLCSLLRQVGRQRRSSLPHAYHPARIFVARLRWVTWGPANTTERPRALEAHALCHPFPRIFVAIGLCEHRHAHATVLALWAEDNDLLEGCA
mmetsp:Transcript_89732/g.159494  ORF Transcript_89732/g.159494 Transcript_89732/m.159494 type:complete len:258 (+) Transcript_89732:247-1020(+)